MKPCCLHELPEGQTARIRRVGGPRREMARLASLGFTPGAEVTLCHAGHGGCRVQLRETCVVLTEDMAREVLCDMFSEPQGRGVSMPNVRCGVDRREKEWSSI